MAEIDSLLFPIFNELRKQGVPLGVQDYLLAIKTMRTGIGLESPDAFKRLCSVLWAKSLEDQERLNVAFSRWVEPELQWAPPTTFTPSNLPAPLVNDEHWTIPAEESMAPTRGTQLAFSPPMDSLPLPRVSSKRARIIYHLSPQLSLNQREMAGIWRQLRRLHREGVPEELDIEGTLNNLCQTGYFLGPKLKPHRRNQAKLVLLIDQQGSMAPFAFQLKSFIESILRGGSLKKVSLYYFHDCPEFILFERPTLTVTRPLDEILSSQAKGSSVLIVSDAGAARGYYDGQRVAITRTFLKTLSVYTYLYAWLNPVPRNRWEATTAEDIACMVPMFPLDREGLNDVIDILRGHPFPPGVNLDA